MKIFRFFVRATTVAAVVLAASGLTVDARAEGDAAQTATVLQVKGAARYSSDNLSWHELKKGAVLKAGCVIQTAEKSLVDLKLGESSAAEPAKTVRLFAAAVLSLDKLTTAEAQLDLRAGTIMGITPNSTGSRLEVKVNKGVAGVRAASSYMINATGIVDTAAGSVVVVETIADGSMVTKVVTAHQRFDPATGEVAESTADANAPKAGSEPKL